MMEVLDIAVFPMAHLVRIVELVKMVAVLVLAQQDIVVCLDFNLLTT
jgi:hypothetical protein